MINGIYQPTFLIYDYETFGKSPSLDRPAQFASIRVDHNFIQTEKPNVFFCQPPYDYLPDPEAVLITGITPQQALKNGIIEADFAKNIQKIFNIPNTCILGYNNINFDDEVSRNIFYRNFYDPYSWSWKNSNTRWDLLGVVRACYALRPEGIKWPLNDQGFPSFSLKNISSSNNINNMNPHDAMNDVYATLEIAKLIYRTQPNLFKYFYHYRSKNKLKKLINLTSMDPLVYVSGTFGVVRHNMTLVAPIAWHPNNPNVLIVCDLNIDIKKLLNFYIKILKNNFFLLEDIKDENNCLQMFIKFIYINKCPILTTVKVLRKQDFIRLNINYQHCLNNLEQLRKYQDFPNKIMFIYSKKISFIENNNVDVQLYKGFFNDSDLLSMKTVRTTSPKDLKKININFLDSRLELLLFRYRARNFPYTLNYYEQKKWLEYCNNLFTKITLRAYIKKLILLNNLNLNNKFKLKLIDDLFKHLQRYL